MIEKHETEHGPLPASVREWYLVPNVVPLGMPQNRWAAVGPGTLWYDFSNQDRPATLEQVLAAVASPLKANRRRFARIMVENQGVVRWHLLLNKVADPPVWGDTRPDDPRAWAEVAPSFSAFLSDWFARFYVEDWTPISGQGVGGGDGEVAWDVAIFASKPHINGLWLRTPDEPFQPPVIDFLTDHFGEPERTPRAGNVTTHTFHPSGGTIRVTADHPALTGGLSAWWVHADTPERLAEFATLLRPWGTLRDSLRADTDAARAVLQHVRGG
jgi:hypothetical protein